MPCKEATSYNALHLHAVECHPFYSSHHSILSAKQAYAHPLVLVQVLPPPVDTRGGEHLKQVGVAEALYQCHQQIYRMQQAEHLLAQQLGISTGIAVIN